jgi:hypothetical protein
LPSGGCAIAELARTASTAQHSFSPHSTTTSHSLQQVMDGGLLQAIQAGKGLKSALSFCPPPTSYSSLTLAPLRAEVGQINDRSAPPVAGAVVGEAPSGGGTRAGAGPARAPPVPGGAPPPPAAAAPPAAGLGGIFAGGMPKLKPAGSSAPPPPRSCESGRVCDRRGRERAGARAPGRLDEASARTPVSCVLRADASTARAVRPQPLVPLCRPSCQRGQSCLASPPTTDAHSASGSSAAARSSSPAARASARGCAVAALARSASTRELGWPETGWTHARADIPSREVHRRRLRRQRRQQGFVL